MENLVIKIDINGAISSLRIDHKTLHTHFPNNDITFVGTIPELDVVIVGASTTQNKITHTFMTDVIYEPIDGPIFLVKVGSEGEPLDLTLDAFLKWKDP